LVIVTEQIDPNFPTWHKLVGRQAVVIDRLGKVQKYEIDDKSNYTWRNVTVGFNPRSGICLVSDDKVFLLTSQETQKPSWIKRFFK
jgi:hypothetical protein